MTFITHIFVFYFIIYLYIYYNILFYVAETSIVMPCRLQYSYHHNFGSINNIHSKMVKKRCFMELGWVTCTLHLKGLKSNLSCPEFLPWLFPFPVGFLHPPIFQIASPPWHFNTTDILQLMYYISVNVLYGYLCIIHEK